MRTTDAAVMAIVVNAASVNRVILDELKVGQSWAAFVAGAGPAAIQPAALSALIGAGDRKTVEDGACGDRIADRAIHFYDGAGIVGRHACHADVAGQRADVRIEVALRTLRLATGEAAIDRRARCDDKAGVNASPRSGRQVGARCYPDLRAGKRTERRLQVHRHRPGTAVVHTCATGLSHGRHLPRHHNK